MKFLPLTKSFFLWQEISSNAKKFLPETRNFFPWQENISCMLCVIGRIPSFDRKYWYTLKSNSRQNSVNCCKNFVWARRFHGNLAPWFPGNIPPWSHRYPDTDTQNSYRYQIPIAKIHTDTDTRYQYLACDSYRYRYQKNPPIPEVIPIPIP